MNHIINLKNFHFEQLITNHFSLDEIFLLQLVYQGYKLDGFKARKISLIIIKKMVRDNLITEEGFITESGKNMYESLFSEGEELKLNKIEQTEDDFAKFWKAFPRTDRITVDEKPVFKMTRVLQNDPEKCKIKFHTIISEGKYTADEIIKAVQMEVQTRINDSLKKKTNNLSYMKNSHAWLNQKVYEALIEEIREGKEVKPIEVPKQSNAVDI